MKHKVPVIFSCSNTSLFFPLLLLGFPLNTLSTLWIYLLVSVMSLCSVCGKVERVLVLCKIDMLLQQIIYLRYSL